MLKAFLILIVMSANHFSINAQGKPANYQYTAQEFVRALKNGEDIKNYIEIFRYCKHSDLQNQIATDDQKKTFWINLYNAYIQVILKENPEKYNDRSKFFKEKQIDIGGEKVSFADIEHGVLRRSKNELFLGYISKLFPSSFEKKFRVNEIDYRIHFALNCGAKSCPPVAIYNIERINEQLEAGTEKYLKEVTVYNSSVRTAYTTSLFSWFRGDFGGIKGIKSILLNLNLIPDEDVTLKISEYDWTLSLGDFIEL
ncbi:MAG: DUF547 domain-containing protein [Saprospiraceae bacterium]|nr:DUF547 domain-containing protein [Saprospiraceae bacterium]